MRISMIGPVYPYRGGIAHYTGQLVQALVTQAHTVQTISFQRQYPGWLYPGASDKDPSRFALQVEAEYLLDPLYPWTWQKAVQQIARFQPDLVVIQWWTTFWAPAYTWLGAALRRRGLKVVFVIHNVLPHEQRFFDPWLARMALRMGHTFVAQTAREKSRLLDLLPGREIAVCPLPIYTLMADARLPRDEARRRLGYTKDRPLLLFFGIVRPYKGLRYLIEALPFLNARGTFPDLLVAGEIWEDREAYRAQIERLGLAEQVRLEDRYVPDEEAAVMFSAADLLVAPYIDGTQSAAAVLALGFGLPLVVTEVVVGGIAPENQKNIRVAPAADAEALASAIEGILLDQTDHVLDPLAADADWLRLVQTLEAMA